MKDLSITQDYFLCALNEKGILPALNNKIPVCILAGGIIELLQCGCTGLDKENLKTLGDLPANLHYLKPVYENIKMHGSVKINKILTEYAFSLSGKKLEELVNNIGNALAKKGCVQISYGGFF